MSSIVPVNRECNQNCIYCSAAGDAIPPEKAIRKQILAEHDQLVLTGGEPLLRKDLLAFVRIAKAQGLEEIELQSNGTLFCYEGVAKKLVDAGVSIFNINFPSHDEKTSSRITQTKGFFKKRIQGIKNLLGAGANVRITNIVCSLNSGSLFEFSKFVKREFPGIKFIEFNSVKLKGSAEKNKWLAPNLCELEPELKKALDYCSRENIRAVVDGVPLCRLKGNETVSVDLIKIVKGKKQRLHAEKEKGKKCKDCSMEKYCLGTRKGYLELFGEKILEPMKVNPESILKKIR